MDHHRDGGLNLERLLVASRRLGSRKFFSDFGWEKNKLVSKYQIQADLGAPDPLLMQTRSNNLKVALFLGRGSIIRFWGSLYTPGPRSGNPGNGECDSWAALGSVEKVGPFWVHAYLGRFTLPFPKWYDGFLWHVWVKS